MHGATNSLTGGLVSVDEGLEREFEARLVESSTLAFRVAYGVLHHRQDAEDVAQEAFVKAHRNFRQLRDRDRFRAWLVRLTWRLAIDRQRSDRRREARERLGTPKRAEDPAREGGSPAIEDEMVANERAAQLWRAIDALPDKLRVVVVLAGIQEHDLREVARLLDLPEGTVKSRMFLARQQLKERLQWTMR
jgi:RNA polymerase sigma-70 factor (ECF subfamily)